MQCRLCGDQNEDESEKHLLNCQNIIQEQAKLTVDHNCDSLDLSNARYEDIFSEESVPTADLWRIPYLIKLLKQRNHMEINCLNTDQISHLIDNLCNS